MLDQLNNSIIIAEATVRVMFECNIGVYFSHI